MAYTTLAAALHDSGKFAELCYYAGVLEAKTDAMEKKLERQSKRIRYLEGATNHAVGTPLSRARQENTVLRKALHPFVHPDLCCELGGNVQGNDSPIYARNKAILTLGDFRAARSALKETNHESRKLGKSVTGTLVARA